MVRVVHQGITAVALGIGELRHDIGAVCQEPIIVAKWLAWIFPFGVADLDNLGVLWGNGCVDSRLDIVAAQHARKILDLHGQARTEIIGF
jgi:hypothetical protein